MKKNILFLATILVANAAQAQFYLQAKGGYAFPASIQRINGISDIDGDNVIEDGVHIETWNAAKQKVDVSDTPIYGSGGAGVTTSLTAGYMLTKHFGVELAVHYFESERSHPQHTENVIVEVDNSPTVTADFYAKSRQVRIAPSVVVCGNIMGISPYARFGLLLPVAGQVEVEAHTILNDPSSGDRQETDLNVVINGAFSLGYNTAFGLSVPLTPHVSLYAEAELITLAITPAKSAIVSGEERTYSAQGNRTTTDLNKISLANTIYLREKVFVNALTETSNNQYTNAHYDQKMPKDELASPTNYNSLGVHLGVRYTF
ncbi:MAG: hypothetical protein RI894_997 [Bacteroidota bacterium]|jgi:hypothetical protein